MWGVPARRRTTPSAAPGWRVEGGESERERERDSEREKECWCDAYQRDHTPHHLRDGGWRVERARERERERQIERERVLV